MCSHVTHACFVCLISSPSIAHGQLCNYFSEVMTLNWMSVKYSHLSFNYKDRWIECLVYIQ